MIDRIIAELKARNVTQDVIEKTTQQLQGKDLSRALPYLIVGLPGELFTNDPTPFEGIAVTIVDLRSLN